MYDDFHRALNNIGLSDDEIADRHLHLHGWRHFFNTELLKGGLTVPQTQAITGHKSARMTEWYSHFNPTEFAQARQVQEDLLSPERRVVTAVEGLGGNDAQPGLVLPFPKQGSVRKRRQA
jgi:hypothetical protein